MHLLFFFFLFFFAAVPLQSLDNLLQGINQDIRVVLLEGQHRTQTHGAGATAANVDAKLLGLGEELVALGVVKGDESALALAAEVLEVLGVLLLQALELGVEVVANLGGVVDEVEALNLANDGAEEQGADGVAHPGVELAVGLVGPQGRVAVVEARGLGLLGEGDNVRGVLQVPVVVGPELAGGADARLDLVDDEEHVVLLGQLAQAAEEVGRGVVVAALALDGLDDDGRGGDVPRLDQVLDLVEAGLLDLGVLLGVLVERVLELGEGGLWPVEGGDVDLVDRLGARGGQSAEQAAVEGRLEGQDGERGRAGRLVVHGRVELLLGKLDVRATTLELSSVDEGGLEGCLVGIRAGHGGEDIVEALGRDLEDAGLEDLGVVVGGEVAQRRSVDDGVDHLGSGCGLGQRGVVVANGDGGNLGVATWTQSQ